MDAKGRPRASLSDVRRKFDEGGYLARRPSPDDDDDEAAAAAAAAEAAPSPPPHRREPVQVISPAGGRWGVGAADAPKRRAKRARR